MRWSLAGAEMKHRNFHRNKFVYFICLITHLVRICFITHRQVGPSTRRKISILVVGERFLVLCAYDFQQEVPVDAKIPMELLCTRKISYGMSSMDSTNQRLGKQIILHKQYSCTNPTKILPSKGALKVLIIYIEDLAFKHVFCN